MADWLESRGVELVVCAGYMHLLTEPFLERFRGRIVNTHSARLPDFPGAHPIEDALAAGVEETAAYRSLRRRGRRHGPGDRGQRRCPSTPHVDASRTIHAVEHRLLPAVVRRAPRHGSSGEPVRSPRLAGGARVIKRALISVYDKKGLERRSRAGWPSSASSSSRAAAPRPSSRSWASR